MCARGTIWRVVQLLKQHADCYSVKLLFKTNVGNQLQKQRSRPPRQAGQLAGAEETIEVSLKVFQA